jgi:hypothetical protein
MNNIFKREGNITLDENFSLEHDGDHGVILIFQQERKRNKSKKVDGKKVYDGNLENYIYNDRWYYPKVGMALEKYSLVRSNKTTNLEELTLSTNKVLEVLTDFKTKYKDFN